MGNSLQRSVILARAKCVRPLARAHVTNFSRLEASSTQLLDSGPTRPEGDVFFPKKGIGKWMGKLSESATPPPSPTSLPFFPSAK